MNIDPCPFCGNTWLRVDVANHTNPKLIDDVKFVHCEKCGTNGPTVAVRGIVDPDRLAVQIWNLRG